MLISGCDLKPQIMRTIVLNTSFGGGHFDFPDKKVAVAGHEAALLINHRVHAEATEENLNPPYSPKVS